jgi:hypothetical protein
MKEKNRELAKQFMEKTGLASAKIMEGKLGVFKFLSMLLWSELPF